MLNAATDSKNGFVSKHAEECTVLGAYDLAADLTVRVESGGAVNNATTRGSVTFTATGMSANVETISNYTDARGLDASLLTTEGVLDKAKLKTVVSKGKGVNSAAMQDFYNHIDSMSTSDSSTALVLCMLQSYSLAAVGSATQQVYDNSKKQYTATGRHPAYLNADGGADRNTIDLANPDGGVKLLVKEYRDTHVRVTATEGGATFSTVDIGYGPPNDTDPSGPDGNRPQTYVAGSVHNADHTNVPVIPWAGPEANTFYLLHFLGRDNAGASPANFLFDVPGVRVDRLAFRWSDGIDHNGAADYAAPGDVPWNDPEWIYARIASYVTTSRCEHDLSTGLELVGRTCFYPEGGTAEGHTYKKYPLHVHVPAPAYIRGKYKELLGGVPYKSNKEAVELIIQDSRTIYRNIVAGGYLNYCSLAGLWGIYWEHTLSHRSKSVATSFAESDNPPMLDPEHQMNYGYGVLFGENQQSRTPGGIGVTYDMRAYIIGGKHSFVVAEPDGDTEDFHIEGLQLVTTETAHCPVGLLLLYGKVADTFAGFKHLRASISFTGLNADSVLTIEEALSVANIYRLFGFEITFRQTNGGQEAFAPWSAIHSHALQPDSIAFDPKYQTHYIVENEELRVNYGSRTPGLLSAMHNGELTYTVSQHHLRNMMPLSSKVAIATQYRVTRKAATPTIRVIAAGTVAQASQAAAPPRNAPDPQGFGDDGERQVEVPPPALGDGDEPPPEE
jgi:hypothetical protein